MTTADLVDGGGDAEAVQPGKNGRQHNNHDTVLLSEDETADKKPEIVNSRSPQENGNPLAIVIDPTSKTNQDGARDNDNGGSGNEPPDGGLRAWSIMLGSFVINGVLFSIINSYSLLYTELQKRLEESGETEVSAKAALVGSLTIGTTFFLSPIAGILTDKIGIQLTTFLGGALTASGMYLSSLLADRVEYLYLTYGIMYGVGASLSYTPSLVILGHYFKRRLGFVNGIVTAGSSVFTIILPYVIDYLLKKFSLEVALRCLAVLTAVVMLAAILFKPIIYKHLQLIEQEEIKRNKQCGIVMKDLVNTTIWTRKKYVVWALSIPLALFGYFVPYVHIGKFVELNFEGADQKLPVMCIGITSGIGRLVFGYIADLPRVNRILLQQVSFICIGILTIMLSFTTSYPVLIVITLFMGLFDGCFISLLGPIAFDICGKRDAAQAIGFLLGLCSIPLTAGPPIAGLLFDIQLSYRLPFLLAGIPPILGALAISFVYRIKDQPILSIDEGTPDVGLSLTDSKSHMGFRQIYFLDDHRPSDEFSPLLSNCQTSLRHSDDLIWNL